MLRCDSCGGCSASHMPRPEVLHSYYGVYYRDAELAVTFAEPGRFARHILRSVPPGSFGDDVRILDFGGGDGTLAYAIGEALVAQSPGRRVEIVVMDFPRARAVDHDRISLRQRAPTDAIQGSFELVLASGVLEHVPDVHAVFRSLLNAVAAGGCFYARTPYGIPFRRIIRNLDLTFPAHVHDLGAPFWDRVLETFAFDGELLGSRPSLVETSFSRQPLRSAVSAAFKFPAHVESRVFPSARRRRFWHLVGGWECLLRRRGGGPDSRSRGDLAEVSHGSV